jgi:hypothetical protein
MTSQELRTRIRLQQMGFSVPGATVLASIIAHGVRQFPLSIGEQGAFNSRLRADLTPADRALLASLPGHGVPGGDSGARLAGSRSIATTSTMTNFEIQRLMSMFNQAETLSSNVQKKQDDTVSGTQQKIG